MSLSGRSLARLSTCHSDLRRLVTEVAKRVPTQVLCGHRTKPDQDKAFLSGASKLRWPKSKHNSFPSRAVDIAPAILDWQDIEGFRELAKVVMRCARELGIKVRHGADWDMDGNLAEKGEWDWPHWELVEEPSKGARAA